LSFKKLSVVDLAADPDFFPASFAEEEEEEEDVVVAV